MLLCISGTDIVSPMAGFYNWNRIKVRYCDGSSFTGDVAAVDPVSCLAIIKHSKFYFPLEILSKQHEQATGLYFRGARVFRAVMADLLAKGMGKAVNVSVLICRLFDCCYLQL